MISLGIPPLVVSQQPGIHLSEKTFITGCLIDLIDSPANQRRLAVAGIILRRISVYTINHHSVRLLIIEHRTDIVFGKFRIEISGAGTEAPAVPCPQPYKISYRMTWNNTVMKQSSAGSSMIGSKCGHGLDRNTVIIRWHIIAQCGGKIPFPTFAIIGQCRTGIIKKSQNTAHSSHRFILCIKKSQCDMPDIAPLCFCKVIAILDLKIHILRKRDHKCLT